MCVTLLYPAPLIPLIESFPDGKPARAAISRPPNQGSVVLIGETPTPNHQIRSPVPPRQSTQSRGRVLFTCPPGFSGFFIIFANIQTKPNRGDITSSRTHQEQQQQDLHLATTEMVTEGMLGVRGEYIGHTSWIASSYQRVFAYHTRPNHTRLHHTSPVQCRLIIRCT